MAAPSWFYGSMMLLFAFIAAAGMLAKMNGRPALWSLVQGTGMVFVLWLVVDHFKA
jgi:hypothetical protein